MNSRSLLFTAYLLAFLVACTGPLRAETVSADTNTTTVDTRGGTIIRGQIVDGTPPSGPYLPLAGVTVSFGTTSAVTGADSTFSLSADLTTPGTFQAARAEFTTHTDTVQKPAEGDVVDLGLIPLRPATDKPIVESVTLTSPEGVYLRGLPERLRSTLSRPVAEAMVNWNGNTPENVEFWADGQLVGTKSGSGPSYTLEIPIDTYFKPSFNAQYLKIVAKAKRVAPAPVGKESEPLLHTVNVVSLPNIISRSLGASDGDNSRFWADINLKLIEETVEIPKLGGKGQGGKYGTKLEAGLSFDYTFKDGSWELAVGGGTEIKKGKRGRRPKFPGFSYSNSKFYMGNRTVDVSMYVFGNGSLVRDPFKIDKVGGGMKVGFEGELARYGLNDFLFPGSSFVLKNYPNVEKRFKAISIRVDLKLDGEGKATFTPVWPPDLSEVTLKTSAEVIASIPLEYEDIKLKLWAGGKGSLTFGVPEPYIREAGIKISVGIEANVYVFEYGRKWVLVEYPESSSSTPARRMANGGDESGVMAAASNRNAQWQPMARSWREQGAEEFVLDPAAPSLNYGIKSADLKLYSGMENRATPGAIYKPATLAARRITSDPVLPAEAELPLLQNVFPYSEPALAAHGNEQMLLYVRDTGAENAVHFTEIAWTRFDGANWSSPATLSVDTRGQFAPRVSYDGSGNAVAVWERIKDPALSTNDLDQVSAQMEIVTATWNHFAGTWGPVTALTQNNHLDHSPALAGPLTNGDLLLTWRDNTGNFLYGTTDSASRVLTRRWDMGSSSWGAEQILIADLRYELSTSFAAAGDKAVFLMSRDMDEEFATEEDRELFYRVWDEAAGTWGVLTRYTSDSVADRNANVAVAGNGNIYAVWQRGSDLVMDRNLSNSPLPVREDSVTAGFEDFILTLSPSGNPVVLWQEMTDFRSDAHYRVFDSVSETWGLDTLLSNDADMERSFSTAWDAMGNLVIAYNNEEIITATEDILLENGETVTVEGVPQRGRVDLLVAKRAMVKDLSFSEDGLNAQGETFLPGAEITVDAVVKNTGNAAVENVAVTFYNGDPAAGGTLIQTVIIPGWLKAADESVVRCNWTVPEPNIARTIYAKIDEAGVVSEYDETNNMASLPLNGVDLQLEYLSGTALRDGSARVVARVLSLSPPESPVTSLRMKSEDGRVLLAEKSVSQQAPGGTQDIAFDLPAGTQPEGSRGYRLIVDEEAATGDLDPDNNATLFSLSLWIDDDNDGIPRSWEAANGMSDSNSADASLDVDGDGFTAKQEYLSGTDPRDAASVLKVGEVAKQSTEAGGGYAISWASHTGALYHLERSYDLKSWAVLARNVAATPPLNTIVDADVAPFGQAFYRLVLLESPQAFDYAPLTRAVAFQVEQQASPAAIVAQLSWQSLAGKTYAVERSTDMVNWKVIAENIPPTLPQNTYQDIAPASQTKAFYRVLER